MRSLAAAVALFGLAVAATPAQRAREALQMLAAGRAEEAVAGLDSLAATMPHNPRLAYDLAVALFADSVPAASDSVLGALPDGGGALSMPPDTLASARRAASLASAMAEEDYQGVRQAADELRASLVEGEYVQGVDPANLEAALNWLALHEPPPPQEGGGGSDQDQQDDSQQQQDRSSEQEDGGESPQQQDQDEQEETDGRDESRQQDGAGSPEVPDMPEEMTPEMARRILDMVEEASPQDTVKAGAAAGGISW